MEQFCDLVGLGSSQTVVIYNWACICICSSLFHLGGQKTCKSDIIIIRLFILFSLNSECYCLTLKTNASYLWYSLFHHPLPLCKTSIEWKSSPIKASLSEKTFGQIYIISDLILHKLHLTIPDCIICHFICITCALLGVIYALSVHCWVLYLPGIVCFILIHCVRASFVIKAYWFIFQFSKLHCCLWHISETLIGHSLVSSLCLWRLACVHSDD